MLLLFLRNFVSEAKDREGWINAYMILVLYSQIYTFTV
jgi:hypothetical protein